jgi:hypothetical protein
MIDEINRHSSIISYHRCGIELVVDAEHSTQKKKNPARQPY